jgi:hypothetical protein
VESGDRRSGSGMWKADTSNAVAPRLCRLRTDGLAPASKYLTYRSHAGDIGLVSLVACLQQGVALPPLLQWLARERNWVRTRGSVSCRPVDCIRSPFSQE